MAMDTKAPGRSRSRVRSNLSGEYRIRDEEIGTSKNIKSFEQISRPHRSLSRLSHTSTKASEPDLLQHALTNYRNVAPSLNKNIPMVHERRPLMKRWNSIQYLSDETSVQSVTSGNSISPLTVIKDQYDTKRPVSNYATASIDNFYKDASTPPTPTAKKSDDGLISSKIYNKMVDILHGAPPETPLQSSVNHSEEDTFLRYQSELDESEEEDSSWVSPNIQEENSTVDLSSLMKEINEFQDNFVQKVNTDNPSSRTQRKMLDYKDLYVQDDLNTLQQQRFDYNFRIQHERIMHQYDQIRLRFSDAPDFNLYTHNGQPIKANKHLRSNRGPLGYLNRVKPSDTRDMPLVEPDKYIRELWAQELAMFNP